MHLLVYNIYTMDLSGGTLSISSRIIAAYVHVFPRGTTLNGGVIYSL